MTRDRGSWSGSRYLETKRIRRLRNTEVASARLTSFPPNHRRPDRFVQKTPYKPLEKLVLQASICENAFSAKTLIKMSVLAPRRGSSFHACFQL